MKALKITIVLVLSVVAISCSTDDSSSAPYKSAAFQFENTVAMPIPDYVGPGVLTEAVSTINVAITGTIKDYRKITLEMNVTHTFQNDLQFILTAPDNTEKTFIYRAGTGYDYVAANKLRFNALFTNVLPATDSDFLAGDYKETNSSDSTITPIATLEPIFAFLQGKNIGGIWKLRIRDHSAGDTGTLNSWKLLFAEDALN